MATNDAGTSEGVAMLTVRGAYNLLKNFSWSYNPFVISCTVKLVLSGHSKRRLKIGLNFQDQLSLNAGQKQSFPPSLSYHLSLRSLFCLFLSCRLRQVLLYVLNLVCVNSQQPVTDFNKTS